MQSETEHKGSFVELNAEYRRRPTKRPTNLRLEGELQVVPEYRDRFPEHPPQRPPDPIRPRDHRILDGATEMPTPALTMPPVPPPADGCQSESQSQFIGYAQTSTILPTG